MLHELDVTIFRMINGWPDWPREFFVFLSEGIRHTPMRVALGLLVLGMILAKGRPRFTIIQALLAWPIANGFTDLLKNGLKVPRPNVQLLDVILRTDHLTSFGTASAHSANMAAVATIFVWRLGWWGAPWVLVALLTGISRVYVGVHYPSQVLFGWLCGVVAGSLVAYTVNKLDFIREGRKKIDNSSGPTEHSL